MFRLSALNEQTNQSSTFDNILLKGTKEAQEAYAFNLYNNALQLQRDQRHEDAISVYEDLLETALVTTAANTLVDENGEATERPLKDPGLILKYSTHKNMASMAADRGDITTAMEHYLQAVMLDPTDVTLWHRIGSHAIALGRLALARHAFTSGLECNNNYWPCLDSAITVLYALSDYETCLFWISKALEKDYGYLKGLVFKEKMCLECPHLRADYQHLFKDCSLLMYDVEIDEVEAMHYIEEALQLREHYRCLCLPSPPKPCELIPPLKKLSWVDVGKCLISTYEMIINSTVYSLLSPICFGNMHMLKEKEIQDISQIKEVIVETVENRHSSQDDQTEEVVKDEASTVSQSADESTGLSEDSVPGLEGEMQQEQFSSKLCLSQEIWASQDLDDSSVLSDVHELMDEVLHTVSSPSDKNSLELDVVNVMEDILANIVENTKSNENIVKKIILEILSAVDKNLSCYQSSKVITEREELLSLDDEEEDKLKNILKQKKFFLDKAIEEQFCNEEQMKRRSNRVRISSKKKTKSDKSVPEKISIMIEYKKLILDMLPKRISSIPTLSDSSETASFNPASEKSYSFNLKNLYADESDDVFRFLKLNEGKFITTILQDYCKTLSKKIHCVWNKSLPSLLAKIFAKTRSHFSDIYLDDVDDNMLAKEFLFTTLSCVECCVDCCTKKKNWSDCPDFNLHEQFSILTSAAASHQRFFKLDDSSLELYVEKSRNRDWKAFALRTFWTRAHFYKIISDYENSLNDLEICHDILTKVKTNAFSGQPHIVEPPESYIIELPNLEHHPIISLNHLNARMKNLEQIRLIDRANTFFEQKNYEEVIKIIKPTVETITTVAPVRAVGGRAKQLRYLLLSCQYLPDHSTIFNLSGKILLEIMNSMRENEASKSDESTSTSKKRNIELAKQWNSSLVTSLQTLDKVMKISSVLLKDLSVSCLSLLCHGLIEVLEHVLVGLERGNFSNFSILAWILLYKAVASLEEDDDVFVGEKPPSLCLLSLAHKWLGEKGYCCESNGNLLKFTISEIGRRFASCNELSIKEECRMIKEQCFYCLYSYPNRPKTKRIIDHSAKGIPFTWRDGFDMFRHFRPEVLPEFDSYKASTVSLDLSQLLHRTIPLVPSQLSSLIPNSEAALLQFIEGNCENPSILRPAPKNDDVLTLSDMYYLLADYNFKNNEMGKAVKYYLMDLRINYERFDSWAGMALARSSQADERLRLCETKKSHQKPIRDSGTERRGIAALSCFKQALSIESSNTKLWIEYGSLAYWLHSMLSRKLKRGIKLEEDEIRKKTMLELARKCFETALDSESDEIQDEEWLIYYMLGKISEKQQNPLKEFIGHYQTAAYTLHKRHAKYPKKIQAKYAYVNDFAIEALEMYFRIHASLLKYTSRHPFMLKEEQIYIHDILEEIKYSPFVTRNELKQASIAVQDSTDKASKLVVTSQSSDLTMGSLLPDNVLQALNIDEAKTGTDDDNDTQSSACSIMPGCEEQSNDDAEVKNELSSSISVTQSVADQPYQDLDSTSSPGGSSQNTNKKSKIDSSFLLESCEFAFRLCARRFPHHIKSIYRLAHIYATCPSKKHLIWSRDFLYGTSSPWQQVRHMPAPGLLSDRNKTNLFNGVWRIPMDDIDRPGSFPSHIYRCLELLLNVLKYLEDHRALLHIHNLLHRTPDQGKKYLREEDRILLAGRALVFCRSILNRSIRSLSTAVGIFTSPLQTPTLNKSLGASNTSEGALSETTKSLSIMVDMNEESLSVLMEAYKVYQDTQKHNESTTKVDNSIDKDDLSHQQLLVEAYRKYSCITNKKTSPALSTDNPNLLDEALRFCHQQNALRKAASITLNTKPGNKCTSSSTNHQVNSSTKPLAAIAPQKRIDEATEKTDSSQERSDNGISINAKTTPDRAPRGQITIVKAQGGQTYTKIAPPTTDFQKLLAPPRDSKRLRLDPGLRHLQDSTKKLMRSTSVPVTYAEGDENTPPPHKQLCRTGSCVSDSTKKKLKNSILARTSAALVRKPSITDQEMFQLRSRHSPYDTDSSDSEDEDEDSQEGGSSGRKRKYSDDASTAVSTPNDHPPLIPPLHQSSVITTAEST